MVANETDANEAVKTTSLRMPESLWLRLRHACLDRQISMTAAILQGVELWLGNSTGLSIDPVVGPAFTQQERHYSELLLSLIRAGKSTLGDAVFGLLEVHGTKVANEGHPIQKVGNGA